MAVLPIVDPGLVLKVNLIPRVIVVNPAASSSDAAPSSEPIARFFSQPRCGHQPRALNGNSSKMAPHAHPITVAELKRATAPIRNGRTSPQKPPGKPPIACVRINVAASNSCSQTRNATAKKTTRHPLRRWPSLPIKKLGTGIYEAAILALHSDDRVGGWHALLC